MEKIVTGFVKKLLNLQTNQNARSWQYSHECYNCNQKDFVEYIRTCEEYFSTKQKNLTSDSYSISSICLDNDKDKIKYRYKFSKAPCDRSILQLSEKDGRSIAVLIGLAIFDAISAPSDFLPKQTDKRSGIRHDTINLELLSVQEDILQKRLRKNGIWKEVTSMALCMAYSLILNEYNFDPPHCRYMFYLWWKHGLGNGGRKQSVRHINKNIISSLQKFQKKPDLSFSQLNGLQDAQYNNSPEPLMRLAPIPICYRDDIHRAEQQCIYQTTITHSDLEVIECSRFLTVFIVNLINRNQDQHWKSVLKKTCEQFIVQHQNFQCLVNAGKQKTSNGEGIIYVSKKLAQQKNTDKRLEIEQNWKSQGFAASLAQQKQGQQILTSMEALALALHIIWNGKSLRQCALMSVKMEEYFQSVGPIVGQMAGAIYGIDSEMMGLYSLMEDFRLQFYELFLTGLKLTRNKTQRRLRFQQKQQEEGIQQQQTNQQQKKQNQQLVKPNIKLPFSQQIFWALMFGLCMRLVYEIIFNG